MNEWSIKIHVWGYHGSKGPEEIGPEYQTFNVPALDDFKWACRFADAFAMGIRCNPKVWQANVVSVTQVTHTNAPAAGG